MKTLALVLGTLFAVPALAADYAIEGDTERGKVLAGEYCVECHGLDGTGTDPERPNIGGQKPLYLIAQLRHLQDAARGAPVMKSSGRRHAVMGHNITELNEAQLADISAYYAGLACSPPFGAMIALPAVANRCQMCHGLDGMGRHPMVPNLAGQKTPYLVKQLERFRITGHMEFSSLHQESRAHPIMDKQAHNLSDAEIKAVSTWLAGLPCPE